MMKGNKIKILGMLGFFVFLLVSEMNVFAGVNLKNGNFYISYTDIVVPGDGRSLEVTRTYNSKSTDIGWFGFGWGSPFETKLVISADGSVVVHENGSGARTRFVPKNPVNPAAAAQKIVNVMRQKSSMSEKVAQRLIKRLTNDAEIRQAYARKFNVTAALKSGDVLFSNRRGIQRVVVTGKGFERRSGNGRLEVFNKKGQLLRIREKNGYTITYNYDKGVLKSIKDSNAKQLFFAWLSDGKVSSIWSGGNKKTAYRYKNDNLIFSKDVGDNQYTYSYDRNHNLTGVGYSDKTKLTIGYERKTQFVSRIKNRNGEVTTYKYGADRKNPQYHYWTEVRKKNLLGKTTSSRFEYEIKSKPDGELYTYRIETRINGITTETIYSECCGLPLKIRRGKQITNFEYNDKGLLLSKKSTNGDFVRLEYEKKFNKITKVSNNSGWTTFSYDNKGNLSKATNNRGQAVLLVYDHKGRISKMFDQQKNRKSRRSLSFVYNALGKPIQIKMDKIGKINIAYDNFGEIKKVESQAGPQMAAQVTRAFQNLLTMVRPAGVDLSL